MCPYIQVIALNTLFGCSKKSLNKKKGTRSERNTLYSFSKKLINEERNYNFAITGRRKFTEK
jgi:hypothetical protein